MSSSELSYDPGPVDEQGRYFFDQERLARDVDLTRRVQAGYTPSVKHGVEQPIISGNLTADAATALGELWDAYYPAAVKTANKKKNIVRNLPGLEVEDLLQETYFGLYHAAVTWLPGDTTFLTNASTEMWNYINRYLQNHARTVRLPGRVLNEVRQTHKRWWTLYQREESAPSRQRLSKSLKTTTAHIGELLAAQALSEQMGSLDRGYFADDRDKKSIGTTRHNAQWQPVNPRATQPKTVEDAALEAGTATRVREALVDRPWNLRFNERELYILDKRYLNPDGRLSREEIGEHFGVSAERVRQIESRLLTKLRHPSASGRLLHLVAST